MLAVPTAGDVVRLARTIVLRADSHLARSAARNAQLSVNAAHSRDLEDARALREMRTLLQDAAQYADDLRATLGETTLGIEDVAVPTQQRRVPLEG